jgi:hypothetical protein
VEAELDVGLIIHASSSKITIAAEQTLIFPPLDGVDRAADALCEFPDLHGA